MPSDQSNQSSHAKPQAGPSWHRLHLWELQPVRDLLLAAAVIGVIYLGYLARIVTVPMLVALLLAYLCEPLVRWLCARRVATRRQAVVALIFAAFFVVVVPLTLGAGFAAVQAAKAAAEITEGVSRVQASVAKPEDLELRNRVPHGAWMTVRDFAVQAGKKPGTAEGPGTDAGSAIDDASDMHALLRIALNWVEEHGSDLAKMLGQRAIGGGAQAVGAAVSTAYSVGHVVIGGLLTAFFFYFFSTGWGRVLDFWERLIPEGSREKTLGLVGRMDRAIAGFVRGRIIICLILATYTTLAYWLAGVPAPLVVGPLVGMLFIVPLIHVIGVPIAMALMWLDQGMGGGGVTGTAAHLAFQREWWWIVFAPIGIWAIAWLTDDYILTPRIQGKNTDMNVPTIIFASLAGGAIAGLYGLLIAIPVAACVKILAEELLWPRVRAWVEGRAKDFLPIGESKPT